MSATNVWREDGGVCCPRCYRVYDYGKVYWIFSDSGYETEFSIDCCDCGKKIDVEVKSVPEFSRVQYSKEVP